MRAGIRSLRAQLTVRSLAAALVPLLLFGLLALHLVYRQVRRDVITHSRQLAQGVAAEIERYLGAQLVHLREVAVMADDAPRATPMRMADHLAGHLAANPALQMLLVLDESGTVTHVAPYEPDLLGTDLGSQPFVAEARTTGRPAWSSATVGLRATRPLVAAAIPGATTTVVGYLDLSTLESIVQRSRGGDRGAEASFSIIVLDRDGTVIAHPRDEAVREQVNLADLGPVREAMKGRGSSSELTLLGERELGSAAPIEAPGWTVLVTQPTAEAFAPWRKLRDALVVALLVAVLLGAITGLRGARGVMRPLTALAESTRRVAEGDYQPAQPARLRFSELEELAASFGRMVEAVRAREEALARSIEEVKQAAEERERLEQQLYHAQRVEAVGRLAGGVAHDFNNLLTVIVSEGQLLLEELPEGDARAGVQGILAAAERAGRLTRSLLAHSRKQVLATQPVDLVSVTRSVAAMVKRLIGEDIQLTLEVGEGPLVAVADTGQLEQVMVNLCTNARDAMPRGGDLRLSIDRVELDEASARAAQVARPGAHARIAVKDTGVGMDAATRARLFEPFFTTKPVGKGTGLGLSIASGIVRQHGGSLEVKSAPGEGSTFTALLPLTGEAVGATVGQVAGPVAARGEETILLAEDEPLVRRVLARTLTGAGYRVLQAMDGAEAVRLFQAHAGEVALCLLDVIMPVMNGRDAAEAITRERPGVPVLLASGYTADLLADRGLPPGLEIMAKPVEPGELLQRVRAMLDRKSARSTPPAGQRVEAPAIPEPEHGGRDA